MPKYVIDSSALIALLIDEQGSEIICDKIQYSVMSSVNYAETVAVLSRKMEKDEILSMLQKLVFNIEAFTEEDAINSGILYNKTKEYGLSLGDRACIALGQRLGLEIYTADKVWGKINVDVKITIIR